MSKSAMICKELTFIIVLAVIFKIVPHSPNFSPQIILILYLGDVFSKWYLFIGVLLLTFLSDIAISLTSGHSILGMWSFYTYSAYILITYSMYFVRVNSIKYNLIFMGVFSSIFFWLWTNFGVWTSSGMYSRSWQGFLECYILALPFLNNSLLASLIYGGLFIIIRNANIFIHAVSLKS